MKLLVISSNYPSSRTPSQGTFVYEMVQEFVRQQCDVSVISPQKFQFFKGHQIGYGSESARVYRPSILSFSNRKTFLVDTFHLTTFFHASAIQYCLKRYSLHSDIIYCHFIFSALTYHVFNKRFRIPVFVSVGEYFNIDIVRSHYSDAFYDNFIRKITGFIAVSHQVRVKLTSLGVENGDILVEPNGVDRRVFRVLDKEIAKKKFGFPSNKKVVLFVGRFVHNKGPLRVLEAVNRLPDDVVVAFVGKGPQSIQGDKVVFNGVLTHREIPEIMNACDLFVLPTLHEGSSNVIVEAMACGLPIISSNIPEIQAQCSSSFSILIDPLNVDEIKLAIQKLILNDTLRSSFSNHARVHSKKFDLSDRARRILDFMKSKISVKGKKIM